MVRYMLNNKAMQRKLDEGSAIDVGEYEHMTDGLYRLPLDLKIGSLDLCVAKTEQWIWSVGKHKVTGDVFASTDDRFYKNADYECVWLR